MATNRLEIAELDFDSIKQNLKSFLKQQSQFSDYDFEGSGFSVLLDILAYNTHYNAYYLNMVANESFLDSAILRDSVVSHAKTLGYTPYSVTSPRITCNVVVNSGSTVSDSITMPRGFSFSSNQIDNSNYNFVLLDDVTVTKSGSNYFFEDINFYEGQLVTYQYTQDNSSNPKQTFVIPDANVDTNTIKISVKPSSSNTQTVVYNKVTDILDVTAESQVYFLQEHRSGKFQIYFGDNTIGQKIDDGSIVTMTYLVTNGSLANGVDVIIPTSTLNGLSNFTINVVDPAAGGSDREGVDEIKQSSVAQFATQNRLVTFKDYETYIQKNYPALDSISVWGGEDQVPPVYGKVFVSIKPKSGFFISETEKKRIIDDIVKPKSIVAVQTQLVDPNFLYLLVNSYVKYDPRKTPLSLDAIKVNIRNSVATYRDVNLNKFSARFILSKLQDSIDGSNLNAILGSETTVRLQKRFLPLINENKNYNIEFNAPLRRGTITNKLSSTSFTVYDVDGIVRTVVLDEIPQSSSGISSIEVNDAGSGYVTAPTITISGDGSGAEAEAVILNGRIQSINITKRGSDYTRAIVTISGGSGYGATAVVVIDGRIGSLRTIYYDSNAERQIVDSDVGLINYDRGIIEIYDIKILSVDSIDGYIRLSIESEKGIIETVRNTIITIDETDPTAITVDLIKI